MLQPSPSQFPDGEHVTLAEVVETCIKVGSARGRATHAMVGEDAGGPGFLKRVELKLGILVNRRHPRVSNRCQLQLLSHNPVGLPVLILEVM